MILSQLVDADELAGLSPDELREMISRLDDDIVRGWDETVSADSSVEADAPAEPSSAETIDPDRSDPAH